jgi:hypothetical protein
MPSGNPEEQVHFIKMAFKMAQKNQKNDSSANSAYQKVQLCGVWLRLQPITVSPGRKPGY